MARKITVNRNNFVIGKAKYQTGNQPTISDSEYAALVSAGRVTDGSITDGGVDYAGETYLKIASSAERTPSDPVTLPGVSPYTFVCPAGKVVQVLVTGGSGISSSVNSGTGGLKVVIGGTGVSPILTPGETLVVSWTTVPTAVRTRTLYTL